MYPISGRVNRAFAIKTVDFRLDSQSGIKLVFTASLLDFLQLMGQCEASSVCGRQVGRWQFDSKTERSLRCLLAQGNLVNKM